MRDYHRLNRAWSCNLHLILKYIYDFWKETKLSERHLLVFDWCLWQWLRSLFELLWSFHFCLPFRRSWECVHGWAWFGIWWSSKRSPYQVL